jgi:tRNA/tmRNA/rRNA uracil-C5-methylase (TrmA/RlmC/RlmD family)
MRDPKCPYFNSCGGCFTQHLPYEVQLANKKNRLAKETGFNDIKVFSDSEWFYRNRVDMRFHKTGLGFREKGKWWKIIDVKECVIANKRINGLISEVRAYFGDNIDAFEQNKNTGAFCYAVIRAPQSDSSVSFVLNKDSTRLDEAIKKIESFADKTSANNIVITYAQSGSDESTGTDYFAVKGSDFLEEKIMGKTFRYSVQGFFQNNPVMAEKMHEYVHDLLKKYSNCGSGSSSDNSPQLEPQRSRATAESAEVQRRLTKHESQDSELFEGDTSHSEARATGAERHEPQRSANWNHLLDLYGGVGAFGIVNADLFYKVTSVESFEGCTIAAKENIERNGVKNMEAVCMDAKRLKQISLSSPLYVITDPPRSGMDPETIIQLKKLKPEVIIYISCNAEQLGKDLLKFRDYKIASAAVFDLFPQTNHMESVIELVVV